MAKKTIIISLAVLILVLFGTAMIFAQETSAPSGQTTIITSEEILLPSSESISIPETNLNLGHKGIFVKKLQEALKAGGYFASDFEPTEFFGPKTKEAVIKFQKDNGLPSAGFFGPATRQVLKRFQTEINQTATSTAKIDLNCMKTAVEKRENSLITAYTFYTDKTKTSRDTRKNDLLNAWTIENPKAQRAAINQAWVKFRQSGKNALLEWLKAKKSAWLQFETDRKQCKAPATGEDEILETLPETTQ